MKEISKTLQDVLADKHINITLTLSINTDIVAMLYAIEKECSKTSNFANGH